MLTPDTADSTANPTTTEAMAPPAGGYERTDINIRSVVLFFGLVGLSLAVLQLGVWELLQLLRADAARHQAPQSPRASARVVPPEPRLSNQPLLDYARFVEAQDAQLNNYGWVDRRQGIVHMPITKAIDILATRGLPVITETGVLPEQKDAAPQKLKSSNE